MVSFFLPMKVQTFVVMAIGVYFAVRVFAAREAVPRSNYVWAAVLGGGYLLYLLSIPLTPDAYRHRLVMICGEKVSYLLMPFLFAIISPFFGGYIRRQMAWFAYACLVVCLVANGIIGYDHFLLGAGGHTLSHVDYRTTFHHITGMHPTYMAMYLGFSICILLFQQGAANRMNSVVRYVVMYLLLICFLALLAKSPLLALIIIFLHYAYVHRASLYKYKLVFVGLLVAVIAAWLFIPFFSQRINETFQFFGHNKATNVTDNSVSARKLIWSVDTGLLKNYWLTGIGPGRLYQALHERYFFYSMTSDIVVPYYDPHNEYFSEWLCFGLIGIVILITTLMIYLVRAIRNKDHLSLYLMMILYITFFTETVLSTQHGIMFYAIFMGLFFFSKPLAEENTL